MQEAKPKVYFTDGEGPVVFKDLARDIAQKRLPKHLFDVISMWVAFESEKPNSPLEAGDTLSLLVPHLLLHKITDEDLVAEARNTPIANGAKRHFANHKRDGWQIYIISTAYSHLWSTLETEIGVAHTNVTSTHLDLGYLEKHFFDSGITSLVEKAEEIIIENAPDVRNSIESFKADQTLKDVFDKPIMRKISESLEELYFSGLPNLDFPPLDITKAVGGRRKIEAILAQTERIGIKEEDIIFVGDSITDSQKHIRENGGLSIALNADKYGMRNAQVAVATEDVSLVKPLLDVWVNAGLDGIRRFVAEGQFITTGTERKTVIGERLARYILITPECMETTLAIHHDTRMRIREASLPII